MDSSLAGMNSLEKGGRGSVVRAGGEGERLRAFRELRLTSTYPLFLPRQDSRSIDDTDAFQDRVWHLGTHEPEGQSEE